MESLRNKIGRKLYRLILWNEFNDEYMGFEEQGISYEEWKSYDFSLNKIPILSPLNTKPISAIIPVKIAAQ